ncbi:MAG TPA: PadR family transcriptional regulator [Candidatus Limnocylindria bacterium]|nr:PadR family transcriptional regulator [Candidatus Limnocylindria bacterium]
MLNLGAGSGYDLKKRIEGSIAHFWSESYGQIYPMLSRLAGEGLAERTRERQQGKPDRQVYAITPRGREELARWLATPARQEGFRSELLLKLFLGAHAGATANIGHVEGVQRQQRALLERYAAVRQRLRGSSSPDLPYWLITFSYGEHRGRALLQWCDETLRTLRRLGRRTAARPRRRRP